MKRCGESNEEVRVKSAPERVESPTTVALEQSRERRHDELVDRIPAVTGIGDFDVAVRIVDQISRGLVCPRPEDMDASIVSAIGSIAAMAPQNLTEAMLSSQMIAANDEVHLFLERATAKNQHPEAVDTNVRRAPADASLQGTA
jgi:hypothetical protein